MSDHLRDLRDQYTRTLHDYLLEGGETNLHRAYEWAAERSLTASASWKWCRCTATRRPRLQAPSGRAKR